jgi:hypothetical protein
MLASELEKDSESPNRALVGHTSLVVTTARRQAADTDSGVRVKFAVTLALE